MIELAAVNGWVILVAVAGVVALILVWIDTGSSLQ